MSEETGNEEYNAGDPAQVHEAKRKAKLRETRLSGQTKVVMGTPEGRDWMWNLLTISGVYRNSFSTDPYKTAFSCGEQNIGQQVMAMVMKECPELYTLMQKEKENG